MVQSHDQYDAEVLSNSAPSSTAVRVGDARNRRRTSNRPRLRVLSSLASIGRTHGVFFEHEQVRRYRESSRYRASPAKDPLGS